MNNFFEQNSYFPKLVPNYIVPSRKLHSYRVFLIRETGPDHYVYYQWSILSCTCSLRINLQHVTRGRDKMKYLQHTYYSELYEADTHNRAHSEQSKEGLLKKKKKHKGELLKFKGCLWRAVIHRVGYFTSFMKISKQIRWSFPNRRSISQHLV